MPARPQTFGPQFLVALRPDQEKALALILDRTRQPNREAVSRNSLIRLAVDLLIAREFDHAR